MQLQQIPRIAIRTSVRVARVPLSAVAAMLCQETVVDSQVERKATSRGTAPDSAHQQREPNAKQGEETQPARMSRTARKPHVKAQAVKKASAEHPPQTSTRLNQKSTASKKRETTSAQKRAATTEKRSTAKKNVRRKAV